MYLPIITCVSSPRRSWYVTKRMYCATLLEKIILLYTRDEVQSRKSTCNEVHLSRTFENVRKYRCFVICFLALLFSAIVGRYRLHAMVPGSNSANKNSSLINVT